MLLDELKKKIDYVVVVVDVVGLLCFLFENE
jgi:hypothetical protein